MDEKQAYAFFREYALANTLSKGRTIMRQILASSIHATSFNVNSFENSSTEVGIPLEEFSEIVNNLSNTDPRILKDLYKLLYPEDVLEEKEDIPHKKILQFSGFGHLKSSYEYFIRELIISNLPSDTLRSIKKVLCIPDTPLSGFGQKKLITFVDLLHFLKKPTKRLVSLNKDFHRYSPKTSKQKDEQNNFTFSNNKRFYNTTYSNTSSYHVSNILISPSVTSAIRKSLTPIKRKLSSIKTLPEKKRKVEASFYSSAERMTTDNEDTFNTTELKRSMLSNNKNNEKNDSDNRISKLDTFISNLENNKLNDEKIVENKLLLEDMNNKINKCDEVVEGECDLFFNYTGHNKIKSNEGVKNKCSVMFTDTKKFKLNICNERSENRYDLNFNSVKNKVNKYDKMIEYKYNPNFNNIENNKRSKCDETIKDGCNLTFNYPKNKLYKYDKPFEGKYGVIMNDIRGNKLTKSEELGKDKCNINLKNIDINKLNEKPENKCNRNFDITEVKLKKYDEIMENKYNVLFNDMKKSKLAKYVNVENQFNLDFSCIENKLKCEKIIENKGERITENKCNLIFNTVKDSKFTHCNKDVKDKYDVNFNNVENKLNKCEETFEDKSDLIFNMNSVQTGSTLNEQKNDFQFNNAENKSNSYALIEKTDDAALNEIKNTNNYANLENKYAGTLENFIDSTIDDKGSATTDIKVEEKLTIFSDMKGKNVITISPAFTKLFLNAKDKTD